MTDLKPCPFCGREPHPAERESPKGRPIWIIRCGQFCFSMRRGSKKEVISDWNTRAPRRDEQEES